jgi:ribose transport system substrate-binding protein
MTQKHHWKTASIAASAALTLLMAGCHSSNSSSSTAAGGTASGGAKILQIAVIPKGTTHEYWKSIHAGAVKAQQELTAQGTPINIIWKGTESEGDHPGQVTIIQNFITQGVSGIVLAPQDNQAMTQAVHDAVSHKIPVVIIDSALNGTDWSSFVATDNEKGGELAGTQLAKLLNGHGRVIMLPYAEGSASTEAREAGFLKIMKQNPGITLLSTNQYGGPTTDTAYTTSQNLLARFGSQTDGVFASNETNTRGMLQALRDKAMLQKVKFVGFDAAPDLVQALRTGDLQGLVVQNPFKMGYLGIKTDVAAIKGQSVQKNVDTGVALITPANINDPANQEFLNPPISKYVP